MTELDPRVVAHAVERALEEDLGRAGDVTSAAVLPVGLEAQGHLVAREALVLSGIGVAREVFRALDPALVFDALGADGESIARGARVATIRGNARRILEGERTALNFLMRMSGIASATRQAVREIEGTGAFILDTRKTAPGLRALDKYAVVCGGGRNHRMGLYDAVLIKDTHLNAGSSIGEAVRQARALGHPAERITVEVADEGGLAQAIEAGAGRALLDNMDLARLRRAVELAAGRIVLEASGGLGPGRLREVAATGVDCLSLGWLTHSARAADLAMDTEALR